MSNDFSASERESRYSLSTASAATVSSIFFSRSATAVSTTAGHVRILGFFVCGSKGSKC